MERLTIKNWRNLDPWETCGQDNYCKRGCHEQGGCTNGCIVPHIYARLSVYEDTGLKPEQVMELKSFTQGGIHKVDNGWKHVQDLLQAEQDGRLVVLPCKVGDTLFDTYFGDIREKAVVSVGFMLSKSVKHMTIHANNFRGAITEIEIDRIGKEIFYTREEAEAALKGGEG